MVAKKKVVKKTAKKAPAKKKAVVKKKAPAKKVVAKKKAPVKKATAKKAEPKKKSSVKKVVAKKKAPAKKVETKKKTLTKKTEPKKKVSTSEGSTGTANKKVTKQVIEVIKPIAQNEFINLKMAKSHHENPREHAHEEPKAQEEVDHAPLTPFVREEPKVGRNDPCPCGSGLKFKKCCGKIS